MKGHIYRWRHRSYPVSANEAGEFLADLEQDHGVLTPALIVEQSRTEDAVLYQCFEWDNTAAAEEYRKEQAREMLRHLSVVVVREGDTERETRAFLNVVSVAAEAVAPKSVFLSFERVMSNDDHRAYVLEQALRELRSFQRKYSDLLELSKVFAAIETLFSEVT